VLRPTSGPDETRIRELEEQVKVEQERTRAVEGVLADYKAQLARAEVESSRREELEAKVNSLEVILEERARKIEALQEQIAAAKLAPDPVVRKPPPPPAERGLTQAELVAGAQPRYRELEGCFVEWAIRTGRSEAFVKVAFKVYPEGRVPLARVSGLEDKIVPECVAQGFRRMRFPERALTTVVTADAGFVNNKMQVTISRQGTEDPPPRIDSPGE
jgi:hypothetical protein